MSQLIGVGGAVSNADVYADLQLGTADFQRRFVVANIPAMSGLIGGDVLSHYDVEIDLSGRRVRLWQASSCSAGVKDFWMLAPISPSSMRFMAYLALLVDLLRQPDKRLHNRCDEGQISPANERCGLAHDRPQRLLGHAGNCAMQ